MSLLSLLLGWLMAGRVLKPLEDSYEAQRQFVANASHELRAPLTRQRALIEVALADPQPTVESLRAAHERVLASEQHLEQLIAGLLTLTRGQAGLERREQLDLRTLTSEAMLVREWQIAEHDLEVRTTLAGAPIVGDPRLLERLTANLIDNAIRHNVPDGRIEIATGISERHAFLSVANTGPAVPPEQVERLFRPFQRLAGRTRHDGGHGLGLSIVQAIAKRARCRADGASAQTRGRARDRGLVPGGGRRRCGDQARSRVNGEARGPLRCARRGRLTRQAQRRAPVEVLAVGRGHRAGAPGLAHGQRRGRRARPSSRCSGGARRRPGRLPAGPAA